MHFSKKGMSLIKWSLIEDLPEDAEISFYSQGDWVDLCAGPHLMSTKGVKAFKLISSSGAYWRGSEKNQMLARIYGTAYGTKDEPAGASGPAGRGKEARPQQTGA